MQSGSESNLEREEFLDSGSKKEKITLGVIEGGLKGEGIMKTICCPFCGRVVAIKLKKSICKQCSITVILNDEEVSIGEAKKMIVICKK